jgi:NADH-quinone oxidoreductase subunit H
MDLRFAIQLGLIGLTFFMLINASALLVLAERKIMGFMQQRYGPYLVGPHGVLQPLADILKLLFKEELRPKGADKWLFTLAPVLSVTAAFAAFAAVPWGAEVTFFGLLDEPVKLGVADLNVGVLVVFAITSMGVYGIVLAGWASNSKYSLLGGLRASAQMISYELSYATSIAAVIMLAGTLSLREMVDAQAGTWFGFIPQWYLFLQPVGFVIYVIAGVAETNRAPFDFPEAEQELVAGYNTEYSSVRFALFPQAEYINMVTMSGVATTLYLGGWHMPFTRPATPDDPWYTFLVWQEFGWFWFLAKVGLILFAYIWMRWTVPRYRYDQLMAFGWKFLFPAAVINLIVTAALMLYLNA